MAYHHGNLHETLLQHAQVVLETAGPDNLSIRDVAKSAGVSHNAPYRHFKDKKEIIDQLLANSLQQLAEQVLNAGLIYPHQIVLQIQYVGRLFMQLAVRSPRKAHLLFTGQLHFDKNRPSAIVASHRILLMNIRTLLTEAQLNPDLALPLLALFRGFAALKTSGGHDEIQEEESLYNSCDFAVENILNTSNP